MTRAGEQRVGIRISESRSSEEKRPGGPETQTSEAWLIPSSGSGEGPWELGLPPLVDSNSGCREEGQLPR